jgi:hypothetical protein
MSQAFITVVSCLCLLAYFPVIGKSLQQVQQREVVITQWRVFSVHVTHFTGVAAMVYGVFQGVRGAITVTGALMAVSESDVRIVIFAYLLGWLLSQAGIALARQIQVGETDFEVGPGTGRPDFVVDGSLVDEPTNDDDEVPDIIYLPPTDDEDESE